MFVRGGYVGPGDYLDGAGTEGRYWSSVGSNSGDAYGLTFAPYGAIPSYSDGRYFGFPLRCVALGG